MSHSHIIRIRKGKGPVLSFNGKSFSTNDAPSVFATQAAAERKALRLLTQFPILSGYRVWVEGQRSERRINPTKKNPPRSPRVSEAMTLIKAQKVCRQQGWPLSLAKQLLALDRKRKRNPSPAESSDSRLDNASKLLEDFSGHAASHVEKAKPRSTDKTGLVIGELDLIGYRAKRDGKTERYGHHFRKSSRPLLAVSSDGKQLHVVGGQYEFTEAGIEDR